MSDVIVLLILFVIFFLVFNYIIRQKKKGVQCIGCSSCASCSPTTTQEQERSSQEHAISHTSFAVPCHCQNNETIYPTCECSTGKQEQKH